MGRSRESHGGHVDPASGVTPIAVSDLTAPALLGLSSPRAFRELVARAGLRHVRSGKRVIVATEDIRRWLARSASEATHAHPGDDVGATNDELATDEVLARLGLRAAAAPVANAVASASAFARADSAAAAEVHAARRRAQGAK